MNRPLRTERRHVDAKLRRDPESAPPRIREAARPLSHFHLLNLLNNMPTC